MLSHLFTARSKESDLCNLLGGTWAYVRTKCSHILKVYALEPCAPELEHKMSEHEAQHDGTNIALLPYAGNKRSAWRSLAST